MHSPKALFFQSIIQLFTMSQSIDLPLLYNFYNGLQWSVNISYINTNQLLWSLLKTQFLFLPNYKNKWEKYLKCNGSLGLNLMYFGFGKSTCQKIITVLKFDSHIYFCTNLPSRNKILLSLQCQSAYPLNPSVRYHFPLKSLYGIFCHCYMMEPQITI